MDISYRGGNCIEIAVKKDTFVIDGKLSTLGLKDVTEKDAVYITTQSELDSAVDGSVSIDSPGEFEVRGVSVKGVAARRMIDAEGAKNTTVYAIVVDGVRVVVVGHIHESLTDEELEAIGLVDVAVVPVGGNGYTLDSHQATKVVKKLEPKVVIPTHYKDDGVSYEVPQNGLEEFIKEVSADHEIVSSYKIKGGVLPASLTVVEITRT